MTIAPHEFAELVPGRAEPAPNRPQAAHGLRTSVAVHGVARWATADAPLLRVIHKRVGACLRNYRNKELVRAVNGPERSVVWEIIY